MIDSIGGGGGPMAMRDMAEMRQKMFEKADSDSDGTVSKSELSEVLAQVQKRGGEEGNDLNVDDVFATLDADGDGALNIDEMDGMREVLPPPPGGHRPPRPPGMEGEEGDQALLDLMSQVSGGYEQSAVEIYLESLELLKEED